MAFSAAREPYPALQALGQLRRSCVPAAYPPTDGPRALSWLGAGGRSRRRLDHIGGHPTRHTDAKLRQECPDALVDFVSYRSNSFQRLARGIGQQPFLVAASGEDGTGVSAAHGDHDVSGFEHVVRPAFRLFGGDVDTLFCHRGDGCWVYLIGWFGAARVDRCLIPAWCVKNPLAIWERPALWVQRKSTVGFVIMSTVWR